MSTKHNLGIAELLTAMSGANMSTSKTNGNIDYQTRLRIVEEQLETVSDSVMNSINVGFKEIKEITHELKTEVEGIKTGQIRIEEELKITREEKREIKDKIDDITSSIYNPDNGIYRRINESSISEKIREEKLDLVVTKINNIENVTRTERVLKKIAGDNLEELNTLIKAKRAANKVIWVLLTALLGGGATAIWGYFN